jgi:translation initiation factor eIF-2B subunit alpha
MMADFSATVHDSQPFDIVSKYHSLLSSDPDLTPPIAAIESLIAVLTSSPATTISETLDLLSQSSAILRASVPNWIALSAGTDLFQRYLVQTLNRPGTLGAGGDFGYLRQHLLSNGRLFVQRAKKARAKIAAEGRLFIREGSTVLTNGDSRVVSALLLRAAEGCHFRVIYVSPSSSTAQSPPPHNLKSETKPHPITTALQSQSVPVAEIPYSAIAASLPLIDLVLVGAEGVVENGGIISRLGTYQIGLLARSAGKPMYVAAESYKFVRLYPLGIRDLPIKQSIIRFEPEDMEQQQQQDEEEENEQQRSMPAGTPENGSAVGSGQASPGTKNTRSRQETATTSRLEDAVDFTPPDLIAALITENGVLTPSAVSEELIKLWF